MNIIFTGKRQTFPLRSVDNSSYNSIKKNTILRSKLNKKVHNLCTENYRTSLKEIKELSKWNDVPCSQTEHLMLLKWEYFPMNLQRQHNP